MEGRNTIVSHRFKARCLALILTVASVGSHARGEAPCSVRFLGEAEFPRDDSYPFQCFRFSDSGKDLLLERATFAKDEYRLMRVISLDSTRQGIVVTDKPASDGVWRVGEKTVADATVRKGEETRPEKKGPYLVSETARPPAKPSPSGAHFEDQRGRPAPEGVSLFQSEEAGLGRSERGHPGIDKLLFVNGDSRKEVASDVFIYRYDPIASRVLAFSGNGYVLVDLEAGTSRKLSFPDNERVGEHHIMFYRYWLVPGKDAVLVRETIQLVGGGHGDDDAETAADREKRGPPPEYGLRLRDFEGRLIANVSVTPEYAPTANIMLSEHMLAYVTFRNEEYIVRCYAIDP